MSDTPTIASILDSAQVFAHVLHGLTRTMVTLIFDSAETGRKVHLTGVLFWDSSLHSPFVLVGPADGAYLFSVLASDVIEIRVIKDEYTQVYLEYRDPQRN